VRSVGLADLLSSAPDAVVAVFAVVTQLGDAWFLFGSFTLLYWFGPSRGLVSRRSGATLVALGLCAIALTVGLKEVFALPRPPGAGTASLPAWLPGALEVVYVDAATGDGYGFPSGHALGTTVAYGGAAVLLDVWDRRRRAVVAGVVVALVALSRLVLGVHYLVDVVVGVAAGLALLWVALRVVEAPDRLFALAVVLAVAGVAFAVGAADALEPVSVLGGALGGLLGWRYVGREAEGSDPSLPVASVGLVAAGALFAGTLALTPPLPLAFVAAAGAVGLVVALPHVVEE
jgi:membrane-associated phospholipid phosphatase